MEEPGLAPWNTRSVRVRTEMPDQTGCPRVPDRRRGSTVDDILTISDVAAILQVDTGVVEDLLNSGEIAGFRLAGE